MARTNPGTTNCIVVHYSEIGLKGKNREFFERKLMSNLGAALPKKDFGKIQRYYGRIVIELGRGKAGPGMLDALGRVPGVANYSPAVSAVLEIGKMKEALDTLANKAKGRGIKTFAISAVRSDKRFKLTSRQLNEQLGEYLRKKHGWSVDLSRPDKTFFVEVTEKRAFAYTEKIPGLGGLPVSSSGTLISLISGGIDSPVAAFEMMKRGCKIVFVHFHNWTKEKDVVKDKVEKIVRVLSGFQSGSRLYLIPFGDLQRGIIAHVPAKHRMIVYRRVMFSIANMVAAKEKALGFVTGDSVGQVASQTLENLKVIYARASLPVFAPLVSRNKQEIVDMAKRIGTYDLSVLPYSDCCSFLVAEHPETRARLEEIEGIESGLGIGRMVQDALRKAEMKKL